MSEREANERRKIGKGPISGLAHTAVNADASLEGPGPAGKEPDEAVPAKDTVPQQADASLEGRGPVGKEPDPNIPAKDTVPQQADASQEGQGPAGKEPDEDADRVRASELVELLKRAMDSDETPGPIIRNLSERRHRLLRQAAMDLVQAEKKEEKAFKHFTKHTVKFLESLSKTLEESNSDKALKAARDAQAGIVQDYWDRFVKDVNDMYQKKLKDSKRRLQADLGRASDRFSEQIAAIFDQAVRRSAGGGALRLRLFRERRLLACALVLGLVLGSFFGVMGAALWDSAVAASRHVFSGFGSAVIPLADRFGQ